MLVGFFPGYEALQQAIVKDIFEGLRLKQDSRVWMEAVGFWGSKELLSERFGTPKSMFFLNKTCNSEEGGCSGTCGRKIVKTLSFSGRKF